MHIIYARVSTDDQVKGYSIDSQIELCYKKLAGLGITENIKVIIDDGKSGAFLERPGMDELRDLLGTKLVQSITVYDPDRLSRELEHLLLLDREIRRAKASLYFVTGDFDATPTGKAFFQMRGVFAGFQREYIRENTMRGRRKKAASGKVVLNAHPYGYDWDKENSMYMVNPEQAKVVHLIYDLLLNHGIGCRSIALELARMGILGPKDKPLSIATINRILDREMYCGQHYLYRQSVRKVSQNKREIINNPREEWIPVAIPAIISRQTWQRAQEQLILNRKQAKRNCTREYLLKDILKCALCGRSLMGVTRPGAPRKTMETKVYSYYVCVTKESSSYAIPGKDRCNCRRIPAEEFDQRIWDIFLSIARGEAAFDNFIRNNELPDYSAEIQNFSKRYEEIKKRHGQIAGLIRKGLLDADAAASELVAANKEIAITKTALQSLSDLQSRTQLLAASVSVDEILNASTFEEKRQVLLKSGFHFYAVRLDNNVDWYLS